MVFEPTTYNVFFASSLFYLTYYCYQDLKNRTVDQRPNYFLAGMAFLVFITAPISLTMKLLVILVSIAIRVYSSRFEGVGDGDTTTIAWQYLAASTIGTYHAAYFIATFAVVSGVFYASKKALEALSKYNFGRPAYYPVITAAWIVFNTVFVTF